MSVLVLLIFTSLAIATAFLFGFIWAVRSGQYEDTCTPSMRILTEDIGEGKEARSEVKVPAPLSGSCPALDSQLDGNRLQPASDNRRVVVVHEANFNPDV